MFIKTTHIVYVLTKFILREKMANLTFLAMLITEPDKLYIYSDKFFSNLTLIQLNNKEFTRKLWIQNYEMHGNKASLFYINY